MVCVWTLDKKKNLQFLGYSNSITVLVTEKSIVFTLDNELCELSRL